MSDFELLLRAWLEDGEIPADFKPSSNVEEYLLAILNGVDDDVDPKSRADVLLDAISAKYAGYAAGWADLVAAIGLDEEAGKTPATANEALRYGNGEMAEYLIGIGVPASELTDPITVGKIYAATLYIPRGGGGFNATVAVAPLIAASITGFNATVEAAEEV